MGYALGQDPAVAPEAVEDIATAGKGLFVTGGVLLVLVLLWAMKRS